MFEQFTEQFQSAMKPANNLMAVNIQAFEKLAQQNTSLLTEVVNDTMTFTKGLASQKDLNGFINAQKAFTEELQSKFASAAKDMYSVLTETQEQTADMYKEAFSKITPAAAKAAHKAAAKPGI